MAALIPIRKLLQSLPPGKVHFHWSMLMALTCFFVVGYITYGFVFLQANRIEADLIVPAIFFSGAIFVLLSSVLSLQTAVDVRRVTMLEQENVTDPLTGIFNRRYMDRRLNEEFARAERYHQPLSILLIDLDNFKAINDRYGHQAGDRALVSFSRMMVRAIRAGDVIARYGGDEFMVIATNTSGQEAYQLAERIRKTAESHVLEMIDEDKKHFTIQTTISVGASCCCKKFENMHAFVGCADQMMYQAKKEGRNRTVLCENCTRRQGNDIPREIISLRN